MIRAVAFLLLAACSQQDDYTVKLTLAKDQTDLLIRCGSDLVIEPLGCAKSHGKYCEIVAYEPKGFDDHRRLETLGHELWHCVKGPVHI